MKNYEIKYKSQSSLVVKLLKLLSQSRLEANGTYVYALGKTVYSEQDRLSEGVLQRKFAVLRATKFSFWLGLVHYFRAGVSQSYRQAALDQEFAAQYKWFIQNEEIHQLLTIKEIRDYTSSLASVYATARGDITEQEAKERLKLATATIKDFHWGNQETVKDTDTLKRHS